MLPSCAGSLLACISSCENCEVFVFVKTVAEGYALLVVGASRELLSFSGVIGIWRTDRIGGYEDAG